MRCERHRPANPPEVSDTVIAPSRASFRNSLTVTRQPQRARCRERRQHAGIYLTGPRWRGMPQPADRDALRRARDLAYARADVPAARVLTGGGPPQAPAAQFF
jgi:hypothetical protein